MLVTVILLRKNMKINIDFEDVIKKLKLPTADLYLFTDGSGTSIDKSCGCACIYYDNVRKQYSVNISAYNHGTNNLAELMPVLCSLWVFEYRHKISKFIISERLNVRVEIISDSEVTVKQGNGEYNKVDGPNAMLWEAINWFNNNGYKLHWNHVYRNTNPINAMCDKLAGETRKKLLTHNEISAKILKELKV